jgi:hypothetical protein
VGAGQDQQVTPGLQGRVQFEGAEDLGFLAAHHVGAAQRIDAGQAGNDGHWQAVGLKAQHPLAQVGGTGRAGGVGRLFPADPRADHAAQDRAGRTCLAPVADQIQEGLLRRRRQGADAGTVATVQHALALAQIEAEP